MLWILAGVTLVLAVLALSVMRLRRVEPAAPPAVSEPGTPVEAAMQRALANAPALFARARAAEQLRLVIACSVCAEPTAIVCDACGRRVCVAHRDAHDCADVGDVA